jgi:hypothetical protein
MKSTIDRHINKVVGRKASERSDFTRSPLLSTLRVSSLVSLSSIVS